ncbi:UNVERIFIED_CONTAM: flagellar biosynthetic protein FliR [Brevibacillus sp. OAP136]
MEFLLQVLPIYLLVLVRVTAFFVSAPIFSNRGVPNQFKIGFGIVVAAISFSYVTVVEPIQLDLTFAMLAVKEALIGVMLGFLCQMFFFAIQIAGGLMDMQLGLAMANVIDPRTGAYVPITGNFKSMLATLYFLSINGHHVLIDGLLRSYKMVPIDKVWVPINSEQMLWFIVRAFEYMFSSAFLMATPIVVSLFLVDLSLGIIAKSVPQFNIFVVGLPIKLIAGFLLLIVVMPAFFLVISGLFERMFRALVEMLRLLGG